MADVRAARGQARDPPGPLRGHRAHESLAAVLQRRAARPHHDLPGPDQRASRRRGRAGRPRADDGDPRGRPPLRHLGRATRRARLGLTPRWDPSGPRRRRVGPTIIEQVFGWLDDLNPEQRRAVLHDDGHLLIVAGAGSGKTRTLACRVARLLAGGAHPERILLLTFSRRAAREMLTRAAQLAEAEGARRVWGGTFHSVANRLLRQHGAAVGLRSGFTVLDQGDNADLLGLVRHDLG